MHKDTFIVLLDVRPQCGVQAGLDLAVPLSRPPVCWDCGLLSYFLSMRLASVDEAFIRNMIEPTKRMGFDSAETALVLPHTEISWPCALAL